jgi:hypothetical protein
MIDGIQIKIHPQQHRSAFSAGVIRMAGNKSDSE